MADEPLAPFEVLGLGDGEEDLDKELVHAGVLDRTKSTENRTMDWFNSSTVSKLVVEGFLEAWGQTKVAWYLYSGKSLKTIGR